MKYLFIVGGALLLVSLFMPVYAEQDVNFICKSDCLAKGGTQANCNALCSTTDASGNKTKDTGCLAECMKRSGVTAYSCYQECGGGGRSGSGSESSPAPAQSGNSGANY